MHQNEYLWSKGLNLYCLFHLRNINENKADLGLNCILYLMRYGRRIASCTLLMQKNKVNNVQNDKILDQSKFKVFADDNIDVDLK